MEEENGGFLDQLGGVFISGLGRYVDNATAGEPQPSPNTQTGSDLNVVTTGTGNQPTGGAKLAGTGNQILPGVDNKYLLLGGVSIAALIGLLVMVRR